MDLQLGRHGGGSLRMQGEGAAPRVRQSRRRQAEGRGSWGRPPAAESTRRRTPPRPRRRGLGVGARPQAEAAASPQEKQLDGTKHGNRRATSETPGRPPRPRTARRSPRSPRSGVFEALGSDLLQHADLTG
jgi:hypothetical protein